MKLMQPIQIIEKINEFLDSRTNREKIMIMAMGGALILAIDYFLIVGPILGLFSKTAPAIDLRKQELRALRDDQKNKKVIEQNWILAKNELAQKEKMFIAPNELPALLELLSRFAQNSGLRITSLTPVENVAADSGPYSKIPIKMNATAGTHELGKFLSAIESGEIFIKVTNLKIMANPQNEAKHTIELQLEAIRR